MSKINWMPTDLELRDVKVTPAEAITAVDRVRKTLVLFIAVPCNRLDLAYEESDGASLEQH